jgi:hypothetical protein
VPNAVQISGQNVAPTAGLNAGRTRAEMPAGTHAAKLVVKTAALNAKPIAAQSVVQTVVRKRDVLPADLHGVRHGVRRGSLPGAQRGRHHPGQRRHRLKGRGWQHPGS